MSSYQRDMMIIIVCAICILLAVQSTSAYNVYKQPVPENEPDQNIDSLTQDYLAAEENLWHLIRSTNGNNQYTTLGQIYDTHESYLSKRFGETGQFERLFNQLQINSKDLPFYTRLYAEIVNDIRQINFTSNNVYQLLYHNGNDRLPRIVEDIRFRFPEFMSKISKNIDEDFWIFIKNNSQKCDKYTRIVLAENHLLMLYYKEVIAALLRGYMSLQMSYMILTVNGINNYRHEGERLRGGFRYNITLIQDEVKEQMRNSSREMWACDPDNYIYNDSYIEVTRFFQGYIDNEINLNRIDDCRKSCSHYIYTRHIHCGKNTFCDNEDSWIHSRGICRGVIYNCDFIESDLTLCPADYNSGRRYDFLKYESGRVLGKEKTCLNPIHAYSWSRWFVQCSNCFCYCDEPGPLSDRYFSLLEVTSNINENKIVTGIGITKINRVIHLKISERELLANGQVSSKVSTTLDTGSTVYFSESWKTADPFSIDDFGIYDGVHYHTLTWDERAIDIDTIMARFDQVITGVRFRVVDGHIRLEVRATTFDHETGLLRNVEHSQWIGNDSRHKKYKIPLHNVDIPIKSFEKSVPIEKSGDLFIEFGPSDVEKDAAQSTVPFIDATPLEAMSPLTGIGLHYKTLLGYGGFIAPKLIIYNLDTYITPPNRFF